MTSSSEDDHPEESHDEAEDGDKHHPAQRVLWLHMGRRHQDPHQTTKHLQRRGGAGGQKVLVINKIYEIYLC